MNRSQPAEPADDGRLGGSEVIRQLREASSALYRTLFRMNMASHCHAALEWCGVFNEHITLLERWHAAGFDIAEANIHAGAAPPMPTYAAAYLGEKLGCIFGASLRDPAAKAAFLRAMFGGNQ